MVSCESTSSVVCLDAIDRLGVDGADEMLVLICASARRDFVRGKTLRSWGFWNFCGSLLLGCILCQLESLR